ncbi:hypothetical protein I6A84_04030 [Frankia sp. CNm7]|uniref:Uncharacterized protein n=1 Tax=Frankia nepalensis TaxID=1836974 RepID=A0A937RDR7_9ACTN|nr:hypothetical protein [Frankia nepalensis]MBL7500866.1 hypothetical protein [Frankia nepalensis]MBL7509232.1 hypothetical protein [Frankia nepalensis]MBL7517309.1 hypothetical protein [Frankia nepalensis]MBL7627004.1 hypothetical protein [Frankia nepalensis]
MQLEDMNPAGGEAGVVEAARAIRPYLADLIGPRAAADLDRQLADALDDQRDMPGQVRQLRDLLDTRDTTRWFLTEVLADSPDFRPPYEQTRYQRTPRGADPIGNPGAIRADRYACPHGDYVWYRPDVATPVPACPTHHVALDRS